MTIADDFNIVYPLEKVLEVKKKRVEESAKVVAEKKRLLDIEKEKLDNAIKEKNKVENHRNAKLKQLRQFLDSTTTTDKVQQSRTYLEIVNKKLVTEIEKVKKQESQVNSAQLAFENAKKIWEERRKEVEKIEKHKEGWMKQEIINAQKKLEKEMDEIGTVVFLSNLINKK